MCVPTSFEFSCIGSAGNLWTPERAPEGRGPLRCSVYVIGIYVSMSPSPSVHLSVSLVSYTLFYKQCFFQLRLEPGWNPCWLCARGQIQLLYLAPAAPAEWFMLVALRQYTLHIFSDMFESTDNEEGKHYSR